MYQQILFFCSLSVKQMLLSVFAVTELLFKLTSNDCAPDIFLKVFLIPIAQNRQDNPCTPSTYLLVTGFVTLLVSAPITVEDIEKITHQKSID